MKPTIFFCLLLSLLLGLGACSTKKNTSGSRWFHSFTARYNTFYNGQVAYTEGMLAKEQGNKDNYTDYLPLYMVGNKNSRLIGAANFNTTILKCEKAIKLHSIKHKPVVNRNKRLTPKQKQYMARKEFNPFLKNAWLLMGEAQFQKGQFEEAASTFSYITRLYSGEPDVLGIARARLARCYTELSWFYDAEDVFNKIKRDSLSPKAGRELDETMADFLIRQERFKEAVPYLRKVVKRLKSKKQKARGYYLLGQIYNTLGQKDLAYKSLRKTIRQNPPYELAFNARILQAEVLSKGKEKKMISRLNTMAKSPNNKEFLDQIFFAMGNIHINQRDTIAAVKAYEEGRAKSTRNGLEKGVLLLRLGDIYWERKDYPGAQRCYGEAIGLIDKEHESYSEVSRRSKVLDELIPYTSTIHLQDSLQTLARMSEKDRLEAIDKLIDFLKKKEEEAKKAKSDSLAEANRLNNEMNNTNNMISPAPRPTTPAVSDQSWYFYNTQLVMQGKTDFQRRWGRRKGEDNWRRSNRTVLAQNDFEAYNYDEEHKKDSAAMASEKADTVKQEKLSVQDSLAKDPHNRAYYLAQIPFTPEQKKASDELIKDALYNAGLIEKDQLEDFPLAEETFVRLYTQYPDFSPMDDVYYQLFLLESRWGRKDRAEQYRQRLSAEYPKSDYTLLITAPDYELNARFSKEIEDSLYTATYDAYRHNDLTTLKKNCSLSANKYPNGINRPKFMFLQALSRLQTGERSLFVSELKELVAKYPESDVSELAGMMVKGVESGRVPGSGGYDFGSIWQRRKAGSQAEGDSLTARPQLSDDRNGNFLFILAYPPKSVNEDQLLYDLARYNFTSFMVRNFEIQLVKEDGIDQLRVTGFRNFSEAHAYAQRLYADSILSKQVKKTRVVIISEENLKLLGVEYSFDEYKQFYDKHFAPLEVKPDLQLDKQTEIIIRSEDDVPGKQGEETKDADDDGGEWYSE